MTTAFFTFNPGELLKLQLEMTRMLMKHHGASYSDLMRMPVMHRHYFLAKLQEDNEREEQRAAQASKR